MSGTLPLQLYPKSLYKETEATQLVLRRDRILWRYSTPLQPFFCYFIIVLNYFLHLFLDSLNKWGLPSQPSQSRRQPMRDLHKLGFADDLTQQDSTHHYAGGHWWKGWPWPRPKSEEPHRSLQSKKYQAEQGEVPFEVQWNVIHRAWNDKQWA